MASILVVAESGFGKTSSIIKSEKLKIEGLDPTNTYLISATAKNLPGGLESDKIFNTMTTFSGSTTAKELKDYRRIMTNDPKLIVHAISLLATVKMIHNIVLDDTNYIMQDYYMSKALSAGWDAPKKIGYDMGKIFEGIARMPKEKNFIMMAHGEEYDKADGRKGYRFKTTGTMVNNYITPEGKFDVVLVGKSEYDHVQKRAVKQFVTNDDGVYSTAKSYDIFEELYIPNDMGFVIRKVDKYYLGLGIEEKSETNSQ
jgi:hypothetical protein